MRRILRLAPGLPLPLLLLLGLGIVAPLPPASSVAATPPPGSVQVFFDDYMQTNSRTGAGWVFVEYKVLAYDLLGDVEAYRFQFTTSDSTIALFGGFPDSVHNVGAGHNYVLEVDGACLDGSGVVELASGVIFAPLDTPVSDLTLCLGPVTDAPEGESGLAYRSCGSDTWTPMTLLYPGCAVGNPDTIVVAPIPDNDPNALWITSIALVQGEPTDLVTLPFRASKVLLKSPDAGGEPTQLGHFALQLEWDPDVATYESLWTAGGAAWQVTATPGVGSLAVDMQGTTALNPPFAPTRQDLVWVTYRLADREGETPVAVTITAVDDLAGTPIPFLPTGVPVLRNTCAKGDVIRNGDVSALDAVMALQFAAQLRIPDPKQFCRAELNGNAEIDAGDAVLILAKAVDLPKRLEPSGRPSTADPRVTIDAVWLTVDLAEASGADVLATWDAASANLLAWEAPAPFAPAEWREPGQLRLALARSPRSANRGEGPASMRLAFDRPGAVVTLQQLRLWDEAGQLLADRSGEVLGGEAAGTSRPVRLLAVAPNPFNPATEISFVTAGAGWARLSVFDARGRRVWTRRIESTAVGMNRVRWEGSDGRGVPLASGSYEVVVETRAGRDGVGVTVVR